MNARPPADTDLDRRLRRLYGRLDTSSGFTARVLAEAARSGADELSRQALRERIERDRARALARLRARFRRSLGITLTAGLVAGAAAFTYAGAVGNALSALSHRADWTVTSTASVVLLGGLLWLAVRTAAGGAWRGVAS
jgi:hypothetical protein